ncbi:HAD domain-containing protein [Lacrimispora indolis]|uniref:HAD domain-containing protein n=1 Tax=Lacrimispora indolis TaxID=69825 RepID=UPI001FA767BE|nr:HAD domain-containing protein [[Clostridium] methoxybenzovorans]
MFLDVDGELTYSGYKNTETNSIDEQKVLLLKEIVESTDAIIVLSSSWKSGYDKKTGKKRNYYKVLEGLLNKNGLEIFDITDNIPSKIINDKPTKSMTLDDIMNIRCEYGTGRGAEVNKWIKENNPKSYVILDDENHDWSDYGLENNWIQPSWYDENGGLHQEHVDKAIKILNR